MKRLILSIAIVLSSLIATTTATAQFRFGPTVGATLTDLHFKQKLFTIDQSVGYSGGVVSEMMFPGIGFGIDFGVLYEQRGAVLHLGEKQMWQAQGYNINRSYLHYLDIPLHLRFKYTRLGGLEDVVSPFVTAGPDFGFLLAHNKLDCIDYAGGQIGITAGVGAEIMKNWQVSVSYTWGVTYALKMKILSNDSAQNRSLNLRVAYLF